MAGVGSGFWRSSGPPLLFKAGSPRAYCPGLCPNSSLIPLRMEIFTTSLGNLWQCASFFITIWNQILAHSGGKKSKYIISNWSSYVYCCTYRKHLNISQAVLASTAEHGQVGVHLWYCVYIYKHALQRQLDVCTEMTWWHVDIRKIGHFTGQAQHLRMDIS